jgi:hypothetical protein
MLLFRSEEHVDRWCADRGLPRRPIITLEQLWQMALAWYENRLTEESRRPDATQMVRIFRSLGLVDPFWDPHAA